MNEISDHLLVPRRFCGPPDSGNGGWTAGALATHLTRDCPDNRADEWPTIEVSLRQPPPLDSPMLLTDVIGLDWELVHAEACRWEHVMSETVERRLVELLDHPTESPYGNPIPGLDELGEVELGEGFMEGVEPLSAVAGPEESRVHVRRISEEMQKDEELMSALRRAGALPDKTITVVATTEGILIGSGGETAEVFADAADHIFVRRL